MSNKFSIIILITLIVLISGCVLQNPEEIAKTNQLVKDFLEKYPNAAVEVTYFTTDQSSKMLDSIKNTCNNQYFEPKDLYRITIEDKEKGLSVIAYIDWNKKMVECVVKKVSVKGGPEIEIPRYYDYNITNPSINGGIARVCDPIIDKICPNSKPISSLHIFSSVADQNFEGEGFFLTLKDGGELFIYSKFTDNPHDIVNTARKISATIKGAGSFTYSSDKEIDLYLVSKYDLGAEHRISSPDEYKNLAIKTREEGHSKKVHIIYYKELTFSDGELKFSGKNIGKIDHDVTVTTGGSVYLITVNMKEGDPLNIIIPTSVQDGEKQLSDLAKQIETIIGTDKVLIAKSVSYTDPIYTTSGIRKGWVTFTSNIEIE